MSDHSTNTSEEFYDEAAPGTTITIDNEVIGIGDATRAVNENHLRRLYALLADLQPHLRALEACYTRTSRMLEAEVHVHQHMIQFPLPDPNANFLRSYIYTNHYRRALQEALQGIQEAHHALLVEDNVVWGEVARVVACVDAGIEAFGLQR